MLAASPLTIHSFQAKWRESARRERSQAQEHFSDLCRLVGFPTPTEADPAGRFYTFERGVNTPNGRRGFADVWHRGRFAWEYKGRHGDLSAAYRQLLNYREDLENPPLLVVSDMDRIQVHTNFTGTIKQMYQIDIESLDQPKGLDTLRAVFTDPEALKPGQRVEQVTEDAATRFAGLAGSLEARGYGPELVAHFLVQTLFCLFAEDVGLLPKGLFSDLLRFGVRHPDLFPEQASALFSAMRTGGIYALHEIDRFNGGLFAEIDIPTLTHDELRQVALSAELDWGSIEPAIFGTLFERSLDPAKRRQLGAHYTARHDIERVVDTVVLVPLQRRWSEVRAEVETLKAHWDAAPNRSEATKRERAFQRVLTAFQDELTRVTILDPACGSGNFLYVALAKLEDLEKDVSRFAAANGLSYILPMVRPTQLRGLEVSPYARELAQAVVWIGYLQWMRDNGFQPKREPVLEPLETIRIQDALLDRGDPAHPTEAAWPAADVIIGNPPFLGGKRLRAELGDAYVDDLFRVYAGRVPHEADLVCYFFEQARAQIAEGRTRRAGLLATNSIRGGANRRVLGRIKETGDIFLAWDDEPWIIEGAAVRIAIVGFDDGIERERRLDGQPVVAISADLTSTLDVTSASRLAENRDIAFMGVTPAGPFDVPGEVARHWLNLPNNPNGRPNSDIIRPYYNGHDVTRRPRDVWIVDFRTDMPKDAAALYEAPFAYLNEHVRPARALNKRETYRDRWWIHAEARSGMRRAFAHLKRYIATSMVAKHRTFVWLETRILPANLLIVFAREDDEFFGVLHSRAHEVWSLRMGTSLEDRPRYTPTTCFETFPLPWPPRQEPAGDPRVAAIAAAARELDATRRAWLDPPGAAPAELKKRTLTNLYNQRPTWLAHRHAALDRAVWAAYGWADPDPAAVTEETILARLLALNGARAGTQ